MTGFRIADIARMRQAGRRVGITSICTAHPLAIEAALLQGIADDAPVLIEATCNQVNQDGGYTGMTPAGFRTFVEGIAARVNFDPTRLILGGDHLGPNPWRALPPAEAMAKAEAMIAAYAGAGFSKLHLDTSMGCGGEPAALPDALTAQRAARLAGAAERAARDASLPPPVYVVGTEVPVPGGATHALDHLEVTRPDAALATADIHRRAFAAAGLDEAFGRAVGIVVQPGVEFGHADVIAYDPAAARDLVAALAAMPQFVFEAHSTDYQPAWALKALVDDGFAILKVGPGLTFALREALYALDHIADVLDPRPERYALRDAMEALMLAEPDQWRRYYDGEGALLAAQRHFSYSDRIRYYWPHPRAQAAVDALMTRLGETEIPATLVSQYLPRLWDDVRDGRVRPVARDLVVASVRAALAPYSAACAFPPRNEPEGSA